MAKPILFNTEMVRAIFDGRKTATRRALKPANPFKAQREELSQGDGLWVDGYEDTDEPNGHIKDYSVSSCWMTKGEYIRRYARYKPGDILYVRETWNYGYFDCSEFSNECWFEELPRGTKTSFIVGRYVYRAEFCNDELHELECKNDDGYRGISWHPSIHMPKEVARIFLKVTDVRVERLQDIDDNGVVAEGLEIGAPFEELWDSTIPKKRLDTYCWDANPWVWVIEFERMEMKL
ncbi:MAG: hypothetical protein IJH37_13070 [Clostridia bacterium]|nr:hypothetical protein [Clostridia bacterium]